MANSCLRVLICIINSIYALIAIALIYIVYLFSSEIKLLKDSRNFEKYQLDYDIYWPEVITWIFGAAALTALIVAIIGFFGACFNSKHVTYTYIALAVICIITLTGAGVTSVLRTEKMGKQINETVQDVFAHSLENDKAQIRKEFERIEKLLRCCGATNGNEYKKLPLSCCDDGKECTFTKRYGCMVVASNYGESAAFWYGTVTCGVTSILCLVSIVLATSLVACRKKSDSELSKPVKFSTDKHYEANC